MSFDSSVQRMDMFPHQINGWTTEWFRSASQRFEVLKIM